MKTNIYKNTLRSTFRLKFGLLAGLLFVCLLCLTSHLQAGAGKITGKEAELNVLFLYDEADPASWKPVITEASKLLWNATEGNLQISKINFYNNCNAAKDKADIYISNNTDGASATLLGLGGVGHIYLSQIHKKNDATAHGQLGMVHEFGHYAFGLRDEYGGCLKDPLTNAKTNPPLPAYMWGNDGTTQFPPVTLTGQPGVKIFYCTQTSGGSSCIMDAGTKVTSAFSRTEFCLPSTNATGNHLAPKTLTITALQAGLTAKSMIVENNQECDLHKECWDAIKGKLGLVTAPTTVSTTEPAGLVTPIFNDIGEGERYVLCIDRSGSMAGDRLNLAKFGASLFVGNSAIQTISGGKTIPGAEVGVVQFDDTSSVVSALNELTSTTVRTAVQTAISAITDGGSTAIGSGLRTSLNQLIGKGPQGCIEAIILLSDGIQNAGEAISSVLPDVKARGAVVFTIGVGSGADVGALANIADSTGGKFFFAASNGSMPGIFQQIQAVVTGAPILDRIKKVLEAGNESSFPIYVDTATRSVQFSITGTSLSSTITSPSGVVSNATTQATGVTYSQTSGAESYTVDNPEVGTWILKATNTASSASEVSALVTAPSSDIDGPQLQIVNPSNIDVKSSTPQAIPIKAVLTEGIGLIEAKVEAVVTLPDGSKFTVTLQDSGEESDGDASFRDGVYSTLFRQFAGDGVYTFDIKADTQNAMMAQAEDTDDSSIHKATRAVRVASASVSVTNAVAPPPTPTPTPTSGIPEIFSTGKIALNRQNGLFEQNVQVKNTGGASTKVRLLVKKLKKGISLYNKGGVSNSVPYLESGVLAPGQTATLKLQYYTRKRLLPKPTLEAVLP